MSSRKLPCALLCAAALSAVWMTSSLAQGRAASQSAAPAAGATITGSVVDGSLAPLAGVVVTLERAGRVEMKTTTDAEGRFRFTRVPAGDWRIRAERSGLPAFSKDLRIARGMTSVQMPIVLAERLREDQRAEARDAITSRQSGPPPPAQAAPPPPQSQTGFQRGGSGRGGGAAGTIVSASPVMAGAGGLADNRPWPVYPPRSGETYARIDVNRFQPTREQPLATFGADVDTGAYTNIRRFLAAGQLPPRDAVRIEELLNYFRFDYPAPRDGRPVALSTEIGECPWAPSHRLVLVGARAMASAAREISGRNLVLLIDVSGSMAPDERLPMIKSALGMFVETLRADDTISIVTYAGTSGVALFPTPARQRDVIQRTIGRLGAGGSTNGAEGLLTAYRVARQAFIPGGVNRVVLATDGDFNVGITSHHDLLRLIERERDSGVFLSVFGVGRDNLKDRTMEMLADRGNGHYAYLDSLQEARRVLIREADSTLETVAKDVKFQIEFNPAVVEAWKLIGYEKRELTAEAFNDDRKDAGEMGAGHTVTVLIEVVPVGADRDRRLDLDRPDVDPLRYQPERDDAPRATARPSALHAGEWMNVKLRYKLPEGESSELISLAVGTGSRARFLPFAAAVAEFGLLLRDAPHDAARWTSLLARLENLDRLGPSSERSAFREMVEIAGALARLRLAR